ncbi:MAG: hypothetical protein AAF617_14900 [Bacteroidota bacterium]
MDKIEILVEEYKLTNEKIEQFIRNQHQYLNTALIVIGGFLFFVLTKGIVYIKFLPIITALILGFVGYHYQRTIGIQGYKIYLEKSINKILKENVICYAQIGMKQMVYKNIFGAFNLLIYIGFYAIITYITYDSLPETENVALWLSIYIILFGVLIFAGSQIIGYAKEVTKRALEINKAALIE